MRYSTALALVVVASIANADDADDRYQRQLEYNRQQDDARAYQRQLDQNQWWANQRVEQMNRRVESAQRLGELARREQQAQRAPSGRSARSATSRCATLSLAGKQTRFAKDYSGVTRDKTGAGEIKITTHVLDREGELSDSIAFRSRFDAHENVGRALCPSSGCDNNLIYVRRVGPGVQAFVSVEGHLDQLTFKSDKMIVRFVDVKLQEYDMDRRVVIPNGGCLSISEMTLRMGDQR